MEKQMASKLEFLLMGLTTRLAENMDYLEEVRGHFLSGTGKTPFLMQSEGATLSFRMGAAGTVRFPVAEFQEKLMTEAMRQDGLVLEAVFRGEILRVEAESGKVNMKTLPHAAGAETSPMLGTVVSGTSTAGKGLLVTGKHPDVRTGTGMHAWLPAGGLLAHRDYLVKPGQADRLLKEIGIMAENGKIRNDRIRKYNQIDHFVELLVPLLESLGREKRELFIVDCACGKSYLSFVLNHWLIEGMKKKARFLGIDISEGVVASSRASAERLGYRNMTFLQGDLRELLVETGGPVDRAPDLVISLHACDVATDYALAFGMRNRAQAIVSVPCCQHELVNQIRTEGPMAELLHYGPLKARLSDTLTDGLRCLMLEAAGYEVSCVEWVSPLETPKNLMIRAERKTDGNREKEAAYKALSAMFHADLTLASEMRGFL